MTGTKVGEAVFELTSDTDKFDKGLDAAHGKAGRLTGALGGAAGATRVMSGVMTGAAVGALAQFSQAAADDALSVAGLRQSVENAGVSWDTYEGAIEGAIKRGQELAFTDDQTRASLQTLTESTGSVEEAMKRLPIAMDLARAKHISLEAASKLLGKVSDENTKALKRYGIVMEEGATATDVLAKVQQIAGGQAEIYGSSTKGSIDKVHDAIGEFTEGLGASLGPAGQFIALGAPMTQAMVVTGGAIGQMWPQLVKTTASLWAMIPAAVAAVVPFWPIIAVAAAVGVAILALKWAWENNLGDIQGKTEAVFGFLGGAFEAIKSTIETVWGAIGPILMAGLDVILAPIKTITGAVQGAIELWNKLRGLESSGPPKQPPPAAPMATVPTFYGGRGMYELPPPAPGGGNYDGTRTADGGVDRPIVIQVPLEVNGRELARATATYDNDQSRRFGLGLAT